MRRLGFCAVFVLLAVAVMSILACSQSSGGSESEPDSPPPVPSYAVTFTINGQPYNFNKGFTNYSAVPSASQNFGVETAFFSSSDIVQEYGDNYTVVYITGSAKGGYDENTVMFHLIMAGVGYLATDLSLNITEYGSVGEAIAGTFNGTFEEQNPPAGAPVHTLTLADGAFRMLRMADDTFY
jgi:hypothetical protein